MRYALFTFFILSILVVRSVQAKTVADSTKLVLQPIITKTLMDSVQASHTLFQAQRKTAKALIVAGLVAVPAARLLTLLIGGIPGDANGPNTSGMVVAGVAGGGALVVGVSMLASFSKAREQTVLDAYAKGKPLPAVVRQGLIKAQQHH